MPTSLQDLLYQYQAMLTGEQPNTILMSEAGKQFVSDVAANVEKWDRRFLEQAKLVSTWSKDPSTKVGAILVNDLRQVVGQGYNGFPRGIADTPERLNDRETKYKLVVHAEVNAILDAGRDARGAVLYVYPSFMVPPICHECCKMAIQAGVVGIVGYEPNPDDPRVQRWKDSISVARDMWLEAGLWWRTYTE
jgi:dCMP deaminase